MFIFFFRMDPSPPRRGRSQPRWDQVDEEAASASQNPPPPPEPQGQSGFQVPPMPQPGFFPPMTLEVYQAYMNFWYAQTQAQTQDGQMSNPALSPIIFAQSSAQQGVKLSKLVKNARLLGCQIFSRSVDAIVAKNWIRRLQILWLTWS